MEKIEFINQPVSQYSFLWFILSALFGGFVAAWSKYWFEQCSTKGKYKREAKLALKRYANPLLLSADSLIRNLELYMENIEEKWLDSDYFKMNILYCFGTYFGLCKIIEDKSFFELDTSISRKSKKFMKMFHCVYAGLNSFTYFKSLINICPDRIVDVENSSIKRFQIQAIGEIMVANPECKDSELQKVLKYSDFVNQYTLNTDFNKWFQPLLGVLKKMENDKNNLYWCRMTIFIMNLQAFVNFYDPKSKITTKRKFDFIENTHEDFKQEVLKIFSKKEKKNLIGKKDSKYQSAFF